MQMAYLSKTKTMAFRMPAAVAKINKILALLSEKPMSIWQLCEQVHTVRRTMQVYLNHLHDNKKIYYSTYKYEKVGNRIMPTRYYKAGNHKDAKKPAPLPAIKRSQIARDRMNQDEEKKEFFLAKRRARRWANKHEKAGHADSQWLKHKTIADKNHNMGIG